MFLSKSNVWRALNFTAQLRPTWLDGCNFLICLIAMSSECDSILLIMIYKSDDAISRLWCWCVSMSQLVTYTTWIHSDYCDLCSLVNAMVHHHAVANPKDRHWQTVDVLNWWKMSPMWNKSRKRYILVNFISILKWNFFILFSSS